ncbi:DEAD/DEAH box helicase [Bacteroides sp.]|uniref:DEAD/DEAH box helicase n=2 Tax=Bacteroides sp. TaxID=29523 RepID=UPI001B5495D1|nr:DEAD/DEAH box helicase [Bacteroides sp.]MBP6068019.1 DEAD/DEAH box helicase [Bacteroides sp.]MBP6936856.1 DEAD/DEAH box helicase [Bacteroides sp.]MBP8622299.1 DEAD/DEAH box helicase [Bacteroides sp.]
MLQNNELIQTALRNLKIEALNPMQEAAINASAQEKDVILLSPTGSGKTLAFLLPLLTTLTPTHDNVQVLILVPSRELALQIESVFKSMNTSWKTCCCYGGHPMAEERKSIAGNHPAIIIGTPGRLTDHLGKGTFNPDTIHTLIIDEFDKSLEYGFHDEMAEIIAQLPGLKKRILLSATDAEEIPQFTGMNETVKLNFLTDTTEDDSRLRLMKVVSPAKDKIESLYKLLCKLGSSSSIVFCNHREAVDRVSALLAEKGIYNERFHGGMEQPDRERALYKFRNGSCHVLVSTDLAARGLDIPEIEHIIHYHLPVNEEAFTHRNGRTARWDARGTSYLILHSEEPVPAYIPADIEIRNLPEQASRPPKPIWVTLYIGKGKKDKLSRMDIAGFFHKKGNLAREDVGAIDVKEHYAFVAIRRTKVKQLLNLIQGEKIKGMKTVIEEAD